MRQVSSIVGSAIFFLVAPCVVAGLAPWLIADRYRVPLSPSAMPVAIGAALVIAGIAVLLHSFARFAIEGAGTPAPIAPTERLVIGGIYRHVRNPMYVAVLSVIVGQALLFAHWQLLAYACVVAVAVISFVRFYEEPTLAHRYGAEYEIYRRAVPGWLPRLTPWNGGEDAGQ